MKRLLLVLLTAALISPATAMAQARRRSTAKPKSTTAATARVTEVRNGGARRVGDQIKFLTKFIYLLGGIANGIAAVDEAARRNEAAPALQQKNQQNKAAVKTSIQGFREGLDKLEIDFRTTPELQPYYIKLAGVAEGAATAEQQAAQGQFDAAGRSLIAVVNRLTDVLLAMR